MASNRRLSRLETLPDEILTDIISRVAKISRTDVRNIMAASPELARAAAHPRVYKNLNLHSLTIHPLATRCLGNGNSEAHYIRGIVEYLHRSHIAVGLLHLRTAAEGFYDNAIYLYGVIMLSRGEPVIGQQLLDTIGWREDKRRADTCWRKIKRSIYGIEVIILQCYITNYVNTRATITCHRDNMEEWFDACYYKQMTKFVFII
ncbi:hypothetical protein N665_0302s0009 [Sinapis alba]|nr:hypothetical protein N665_0302s0009 [Sinapis alba]